MYCLLFVHSYMMLHVFFAVSKVAPIRAGSGASLPLYFATFIPSILGVGSNPGECWQFLWMFKNMEHMGKHMLGAKKLSLVMWLRHHCKHGEISAVHWSNGSDPFVQRLTSPTVWSILLPPLKKLCVSSSTPDPLTPFHDVSALQGRKPSFPPRNDAEISAQDVSFQHFPEHFHELPMRSQQLLSSETSMESRGNGWWMVIEW